MARPYYRGATVGIQIALRGKTGPLDITGYTRVRVVIAADTASDPLIEWDTDGDDEIVVQACPAIVTVYPTQADSLNLPIGVLLGQVWVTLGGKDIPADVFNFQVAEGVGEPASA